MIEGFVRSVSVAALEGGVRAPLSDEGGGTEVPSALSTPPFSCRKMFLLNLALAFWNQTCKPIPVWLLLVLSLTVDVKKKKKKKMSNIVSSGSHVRLAQLFEPGRLLNHSNAPVPLLQTKHRKWVRNLPLFCSTDTNQRALSFRMIGSAPTLKCLHFRGLLFLGFSI